MTTTLLNSRYQIIKVLGGGGFGETFLAEDTYLPSRRRCVIKQLKPMTHDPQMYQLIQQRFAREAAILEKLGDRSHQIPKLYAYFSENGQFYLVQEWIEGQTITSLVEIKGVLSETAVRNILVSLLSVLDYVHSEGIIHRDIKPDNIILRHENGLPILIDFGAVKETIATVSYTQGKIKPSIVLGTPGFMSPEQAAGRPSYTSDLYSLGMTAVYMLTGKLPQELEIDLQAGHILWQQYAKNVSPGLIAVLDRAIQSHPRDRYTTAKKMLLDILQSDASIPPEPSPQTTVVMSPSVRASNQPISVNLSQNALASNHPSSQRNWQRNLILGILAGGLLGASVLVGVRNSWPPSNSEQPIASTPQFPPASKPADAPSTPAIDSPAPPISTPQPQTEPQNTQLRSPQVTETPASEKQNQNNPSSNASRGSVPGFPIGSSNREVKAALGNPTQTSKGIWSNTQAYIYDIKPNQITLGYLFDRTSGKLRQTEASFAQSVALEQMQATLQGMLGDRSFINISQGLRSVYQRRTDKYSFNTGKLKVAIERNERDRIYIGVWDADLH
ncbi:MAG TPA: serine/threonine protein kinase [Cyanobacteria bacterium UBA11049]|nr:serine/threonine protein kinase [Cyanobacteria bacterium UBA11049]